MDVSVRLRERRKGEMEEKGIPVRWCVWGNLGVMGVVGSEVAVAGVTGEVGDIAENDGERTEISGCC